MTNEIAPMEKTATETAVRINIVHAMKETGNVPLQTEAMRNLADHLANKEGALTFFRSLVEDQPQYL